MNEETEWERPSVVIELYCQPLTQSMVEVEMKERERESLKRIDPYFLECLKLRSEVEGHEFGYFFKWPVNPYTQRLPNYWTIVRRPMDLKTIQHKIKAKLYSKPAEFDQDMRLMFNNAFRYNHEDHELIQRIRQISGFYEERYNELRNRLSQEVLVGEKGEQVHEERSKEDGLIEQFSAKFWTEEKRKQLGKRLSMISEKGRSEIRKAMNIKFSDIHLTSQNISLDALDGMQLLYLTEIAKTYPQENYGFPLSLLSKLSQQPTNQQEQQSSFQIQQSDK